MRGGKVLVRALVGARSDLMDAAGLALLASAAFTWCLTAGLVAAGLSMFGMNWRLNEGRE